MGFLFVLSLLEYDFNKRLNIFDLNIYLNQIVSLLYILYIVTFDFNFKKYNLINSEILFNLI